LVLELLVGGIFSFIDWSILGEFKSTYISYKIY